MVWSAHRWLREILPYVLLILVLGLFAGFTWLTHHPDAEVLQRAKSWPGIGPLASAFKEKYQDSVPSSSTSSQGARYDIVIERRWQPELEPDFTVSLPPAGDRMWLLKGAVMRRQPRHDAPIIEEVDGVSNVVKLEQRDHWYRVYRLGREGWVYLENYASSGPPYGNAAEAPGPLHGRGPDPQELAAAQRILGDDAQQVFFGPYTVYTDCRETKLLDRLDRLARQLEAVYTEYFDRLPVGQPKTVIVLFRHQQDYLTLRDQLIELAGLPASGHHSRGLIALYVGQREALGIGSTLVHELVHALNRRSLGPALPPWLDEGLADDLAASHVTKDGRIDTSELNGRVRPKGGRVVINGALASLMDLRRARLQGNLPALSTVLEMDWESFVRSSDIGLHYDFSAFWVRYLMQGESGRYREAFRSFLDDVAAGEPVTKEALQAHLGTNAILLEASFRNWFELLAREAQLPDVDPVRR